MSSTLDDLRAAPAAGLYLHNVNQIAKVTNATGEVQDELGATPAAVRRTAMRIDEAIDRSSLP